MGYNQNHAGIHLIPYNYKEDFYDRESYDKYGAIIAETMSKRDREKLIYDKEKIVADVVLCNFIIIDEKKGKRKKCLCGGKLHYKENIVIRFHNAGKMVSLLIAGKQCIECERKFVIKSILLSKIENELINKKDEKNNSFT